MTKKEIDARVKAEQDTVLQLGEDARVALDRAINALHSGLPDADRVTIAAALGDRVAQIVFMLGGQAGAHATMKAAGRSDLW